MSQTRACVLKSAPCWYWVRFVRSDFSKEAEVGLSSQTKSSKTRCAQFQSSISFPVCRCLLASEMSWSILSGFYGLFQKGRSPVPYPSGPWRYPRCSLTYQRALEIHMWITESGSLSYYFYNTKCRVRTLSMQILSLFEAFYCVWGGGF